jgi:DNA-binding MarR family transcriptional regulator
MNAKTVNPNSAVPAAARSRMPTLKLESLGLLVRRVRDGIIGQVEAALRADGIDLTHMQFRAISWLGKTGGCSATELARALEHDPGALTRVLDKLVEKGLAVREPQAGDRRMLNLRLTRSGEALWAQFYAHYERVHAHALRDLSAIERRQLTALLTRVADALDKPLLEKSR